MVIGSIYQGKPFWGYPIFHPLQEGPAKGPWVSFALGRLMGARIPRLNDTASQFPGHLPLRSEGKFTLLSNHLSGQEGFGWSIALALDPYLGLRNWPRLHFEQPGVVDPLVKAWPSTSIAGPANR